MKINEKCNSLYYWWKCDKCGTVQYYPREAIGKLVYGRGLACYKEKCEALQDVRKELN